MAVSDQLREAIQGYGTPYAVGRDSGVDQTMLNRFMRGERGLTLETVDRLCEFFGMRLTRPTTRPSK